jgi:hypothetical protein
MIIYISIRLHWTHSQEFFLSVVSWESSKVLFHFWCLNWIVKYQDFAQYCTKNTLPKSRKKQRMCDPREKWQEFLQVVCVYDIYKVIVVTQ